MTPEEVKQTTQDIEAKYVASLDASDEDAERALFNEWLDAIKAEAFKAGEVSMHAKVTSGLQEVWFGVSKNG